jgi:hypothetical protein
VRRVKGLQARSRAENLPPEIQIRVSCGTVYYL